MFKMPDVVGGRGALASIDFHRLQARAVGGTEENRKGDVRIGSERLRHRRHQDSQAGYPGNDGMAE